MREQNANIDLIFWWERMATNMNITEGQAGQKAGKEKKKLQG